MTATLRHAVILCWIAGYVDAIGYFRFGHVFTANMTGNTVLLAASLVRMDDIYQTYAVTITSFIVGVACAIFLKSRGHSPIIFLVLNAILLTCLWLFEAGSFIALCSLAFSMGMQAASIQSFSGIRLPTVVVTSTLVQLTEEVLTRAFAIPANGTQGRPARLRHMASAWLAYGVGAASAVGAGDWAMSLLLPPLLYIVVAIDLFRQRAAHLS